MRRDFSFFRQQRCPVYIVIVSARRGKIGRALGAQAEVPGDRVGNALAGMAVSVGIHGVRHAMVGSRIVEQRAGLAEHVVMRNARQADRSGSDSLGALRLAAEHQHRFAEGRRFLSAFKYIDFG